jgi:hypothetical protein
MHVAHSLLIALRDRGAPQAVVADLQRRTGRFPS